MLGPLPGHCWQLEPSTISLLSRCLLALQAAASWVDGRIGKSRGKKGEFFIEENKYRDMETGLSANRAGLGFDGAAGSWAPDRVQGFEFQPFRVLHPFFYKTRAKILGENSTQERKKKKILQRSEKASNQRQNTNSPVKEAGLDMSTHSLLETYIFRNLSKTPRRLFSRPCCHTNLIQIAWGQHTRKQQQHHGCWCLASSSPMYHSNHSSRLPQGLNSVGQCNLFKASSHRFHVHPSDWQNL